MIYFNCDYTEGCHPKILERLSETNFLQTPGYGEDEICASRARRSAPPAGGTTSTCTSSSAARRANATVIAAALRPHQGALCAETGHINVHETGAVEATGHKVLPLPATADGKISAEQVESAYYDHVNNDSFEHMAQPKMVYISQPTENGGLYSKAELTALHEALRALRGCTSSSTARASATGWRRRKTTFRSATCARSPTCFTSAAQRSARCSARPSSS